MKMLFKMFITCLFLLSNLWILSNAVAEQVIVNNFGTSAPPQQNAPSNQQNNNNCQGNQSSASSSLPEGTYSYNNDTTSGTIVTTGEKKPYIVDNSCNNQAPVIQPYVYAQPPLPGPRR